MPISKINTSSITDNSVTAGKIVAGAVDADIAAGSIDTAQMADDAVTADKLANSINTSIAAALPKAGGTMTGTIADFRSTGIDDNSNALAMTIDVSEHVLIGKTNASSSVAGVRFAGDAAGYSEHTRDGGAPLYLNRLTNDGTIITFAKANTAVGSIDVSASGASIKLGGTASANALDDYETGTFTATLTAVTAPNSPPTATGEYVKIGNMCYFSLYRFDAVNTTGAAGHMKITGLPFTCSKSTNLHAPFTHGFDFNTSRNQSFELNNGNTILFAYESVNGSAWAAWNITASTSIYMAISGSYITA